MSFVRVEFLAFLAVVLAVYHVLPRRPQTVFLAAASLVFYGWVHPWYVGLLLYSATLDFGCGLAIRRWPAHAFRFLWMSIVGNLLLLGTFKYFDFFVDNVRTALHGAGVEADLWSLGILLPVGISFYTFQTMSYTIDVYRGRVEPCRDPVDYLVYVSFFPQLVAGPIERAGSLLPQIARERAVSLDDVRAGVSLALWGAFKKVVIADGIGLYVDAAFGHEAPTWGLIWAGAVGFTVQMFADFSGYTDIARGIARLLGFRLVENFRAPFLATSPSDFWGRWHISFATWVRDYLYHPLALHPWCRRWLVPPFVRVSGQFHMMRGIVLAMLISGLWHGAAWNFVLWGGVFAVVHLAFHLIGQRLPRRWRTWRYGAWVLVPLMWGFVTLSSLLFREPHLHRLVQYAQLDPTAGTAAEWVAAGYLLALAALGAAPMVGMWAWREHGRARVPAAVLVPVQTTAWAVAVWAVFVFARPVGSEFEYFRF